MTVRVIVAPRLRIKLESHPHVTDARLDVAREISDRAADRTPVGDYEGGGAARDSHRVEDDRSKSPPRIAAVAGEGDAWPYVFPEFGGQGFRPPPAPLRSSAKAVSNNYRPRR